METNQRHELFNEFEKLKEQIEAFLSCAWNITDLDEVAELVDFADCFMMECQEFITVLVKRGISDGEHPGEKEPRRRFGARANKISTRSARNS